MTFVIPLILAILASFVLVKAQAPTSVTLSVTGLLLFLYYLTRLAWRK